VEKEENPRREWAKNGKTKHEEEFIFFFKKKLLFLNFPFLV
jgi:hypothetical protein